MTTEKDNTSSLGCVFLFLILPFVMVLNGLVLRTLWAWFAVPQFHLAPVSIPMAIGLSEIAGLVAAAGNGQNDKGLSLTDTVVLAIGKGFGRPLLYLLIGYIAHLFL